ncbi:MAG: phosphoribosylglycinamide formyltransferase [Sphingobacteriales bacterium]|nr:MAG: phosphoribosylglycinamide formyltransferase [Sphingobacteriales bacterium]
MKNIILFASGAGSNVKAIIEFFKDDKSVVPVAIVCNKPEAGVLKIAAAHNIPAILIDRNSFKAEAFVAQLQSFNPAMLILAGFLWKVPDALVAAFPDQIINIHPALLPKYGGKGMYGMHVHEAVINNKEKESGITIHYVNEHYDEGNTIIQAHCTITENDTPESLAQKIHRLEHHFFPSTIAYLLKA